MTTVNKTTINSSDSFIYRTGSERAKRSDDERLDNCDLADAARLSAQ